MTIRIATPAEIDKYTQEMIQSFRPCPDRDCPFFHYDYSRQNVRKEGNKVTFVDGNGLERSIEMIPKGSQLDLSQLREGTAVYFNGGSAAYYTLKIAGDRMVKAWRDCDSNALVGPINKIISRENEPIFHEGILSVDLMFVMPYFKYNRDSNPENSEVKQVLAPDESWMGSCIFLGVERPK